MLASSYGLQLLEFESMREAGSGWLFLRELLLRKCHVAVPWKLIIDLFVKWWGPKSKCSQTGSQVETTKRELERSQNYGKAGNGKSKGKQNSKEKQKNKMTYNPENHGGTNQEHRGQAQDDNRTDTRTGTDEPTKRERNRTGLNTNQTNEGVRCRWRDTGNRAVLMRLMWDRCGGNQAWGGT